MVNPAPPRPPLSVTEALGTKVILSELSAIIVDHLRTVHKDGAALSSEKRSGRGNHSFLAQLASGGDLIPGLEQVILVGSTCTERCISCTHYYPSGSTYT